MAAPARAPALASGKALASSRLGRKLCQHVGPPLPFRSEKVCTHRRRQLRSVRSRFLHRVAARACGSTSSPALTSPPLVWQHFQREIKMPRQASFVLCALLVGSLGDEATETKKTKKKKRASKDWSKVDLDAVGREWESGDEADELKTESQVYEEMIERRRAASEDGGWMDPPRSRSSTPKSSPSRWRTSSPTRAPRCSS